MTHDGSVYPRVCGGTGHIDHVWYLYMGLSPRVRGNPDAARIVLARHGSIPACAGEPVSTRSSTTTTRIYPRVCGGTGDLMKLRLRWPGLSPRVRGNPYESRRRPCDHRVYPRVCGGTTFSLPFNSGGLGLSPRVRGNHRSCSQCGRRGGSIPACAGEPPLSIRPALWQRVYPRVCGGTGSAKANAESPAGLSPRVRGNPRTVASHAYRCGSIPACAGEPDGDWG